MLRNVWEFSFPLRGRIPIQDQPELKLEVTYLGYTQISGKLHQQDFELSLGKSAKKLFNLEIGGHLITHQCVISRPELNPNQLKITFCDHDGQAVPVMISRAELEKFVDEEY